VSSAPTGPFAGFEHVSAGASFYRSDLHVHSFGGSSDVNDVSMTPEAIVTAALDRGIEFLAITDHNSLTNVRSFLSFAAKTTGAVVGIPGVEITTSLGHVLVYSDADSLDRLETWLQALPFERDEGGERYTRKRIDEIAADVGSFGGLAIPAHAGRANTGFMPKAPHRERQAILVSAYVYGVELDLEHNRWFTPSR
jgi:predicted metal-dependent phosphoesterase TrpH